MRCSDDVNFSHDLLISPDTGSVEPRSLFLFCIIYVIVVYHIIEDNVNTIGCHSDVVAL